MTIFDGVDISPTTPSTLHRVIPFGLLVLRTLYEAGKSRDRRLEAQAQGRELTSVREMMELAGVKLPDVRAAVAELLGGSAELAQAATLIAENPDLGTLLQKAAGFTAPQPAATEPIVTPPPTHEPRPVAPSPTSPPCSPPPPPAATMQPPSGGLAKFRPDFTREGREAARAAAAAATNPSTANPALPKYRPDLTREGREAAKAAAAATTAAATPPPQAPTAPATSAASPQASATADVSPPRAPAAPATSTSPPTNTATDVPPPQTPARPSLVAMVERQLAALVQAANANQAQIDERLRRAEAELAEVHAELRELIAQRRSRGAQVTQPPEEKQAPVQPSAEPAPTSVTEETPSTAPTAEPAAAPASTIDTSTTEPAADATAANTATSSSPEPARLDGTPIALPTGATEEEVVQVVGMIGAVSEQLAAQHQKNLERVDTVQREVIAVKAIVAHLREAEGAPAHG